MNVLLLGAYGLVGTAVLRALLRDGNRVTALGRNLNAPRSQWPEVTWTQGDLANLVTPEAWLPLLTDIEAVVNCAGALQDGPRDQVSAVQRDAPIALWTACKRLGIRRIVQVSALGADSSSEGTFLRTKFEADEALRAQDCDWVILRPGLVLSSQAYGGTALLRALASCPLVIPLAFPEARLQTVHADDVANAVTTALKDGVPLRQTYDLAEPEARTLAKVLTTMRRWQGFEAAPLASVHPVLCQPAIVLADLLGRLGWRSPLRRTAWEQLRRGVTGNPLPWMIATGRPLRTLEESLRDIPSTVQERWFACLWLLKPAVLGGLAFFWLLSGLVALLNFDAAVAVLTARGASTGLSGAVVGIGSLVDMALGAGLLVRCTAKWALLGMATTGMAYLAGGTLLAPDLWADPLGPLVKVIPATLLALVALPLLRER